MATKNYEMPKNWTGQNRSFAERIFNVLKVDGQKEQNPTNDIVLYHWESPRLTSPHASILREVAQKTVAALCEGMMVKESCRKMSPHFIIHHWSDYAHVIKTKKKNLKLTACVNNTSIIIFRFSIRISSEVVLLKSEVVVLKVSVVDVSAVEVVNLLRISPIENGSRSYIGIHVNQ